MPDLVALYEGMQAHLAAHPFKQEDWNCSEEEFEAREKQVGEKWAREWIALAKERHSKLDEQAEELKFWASVACSFPASGIHAFPILITAIRELEG